MRLILVAEGQGCCTGRPDYYYTGIDKVCFTCAVLDLSNTNAYNCGVESTLFKCLISVVYLQGMSYDLHN